VLAQADVAALRQLLVVGAHVVGLLAEDAEAERQLLLEEVGLLEADDRLVGELPDRNLDAELLAVALEERPPVEQVEVGLLDLGEDRGPLERAVAGAEGEGAGAPLLDGNAHVLAARDVGVLRGDVTSSKKRVFSSRFLLIFMRTVSKTSPGPRTSSRMMTTLFVFVLPSISIDSTLYLSLSSTLNSRSMSFGFRLGLRVTWTRVSR
jgi:hypothetical protein